MEMKNNNFVYSLICLVCGLYISLISSIYTFQAYYDMGFNTVDKFLTGGIGIAFDLGKVVIPVLLVIAIKSKKYTHIITWSLLLVFCLVNSFIASQSRDLNISKSYEAEAVNNSGEKKSNDLLIKAKQDEIKVKSNVVNGLVNEKNKLPNNYITARKNKQVEIDNENVKLATLNTELKTLTNKKFDSKNMGFITKGMFNLAKWINPEKPQDVVGQIALIKNIFSEILAIAFLAGFGILSGMKYNKINVASATSPLPSANISVDEIQPAQEQKKLSKVSMDKDGLTALKNSIGFEYPEIIEGTLKQNPDFNMDNNSYAGSLEYTETSQDYSREDIKEYLQYMYNNIKFNGNSPGQTQFKNNTNLSDKAIRAIRYDLNKHKIIAIKDKSTEVLIKSFNDAIKILNL